MRSVVALVVMISAIALAGCNTVRGMGQDLEKAGEAVQKSAN